MCDLHFFFLVSIQLRFRPSNWNTLMNSHHKPESNGVMMYSTSNWSPSSLFSRWLNQPISKICSSKLDHFPKKSGWKLKKTWKHHLDHRCSGFPVKTKKRSMNLAETWALKASSNSHLLGTTNRRIHQKCYMKNRGLPGCFCGALTQVVCYFMTPCGYDANTQFSWNIPAIYIGEQCGSYHISQKLQGSQGAFCMKHSSPQTNEKKTVVTIYQPPQESWPLKLVAILRTYTTLRKKKIKGSKLYRRVQWLLGWMTYFSQ